MQINGSTKSAAVQCGTKQNDTAVTAMTLENVVTPISAALAAKNSQMLYEPKVGVRQSTVDQLSFRYIPLIFESTNLIFDVLDIDIVHMEDAAGRNRSSVVTNTVIMVEFAVDGIVQESINLFVEGNALHITVALQEVRKVPKPADIGWVNHYASISTRSFMYWFICPRMLGSDWSTKRKYAMGTTDDRTE